MSDDFEDFSPPIGHNMPPEGSFEEMMEEVDPENLLVIPLDRIRDFLALKYAGMITTRDTYIGATERWIKAHTHDNIAVPHIELDGNDGPDTLDAKKQWETFLDEADDTRARVKKVLLAANKEIETWFMDFLREPLAAQHEIVQQAYTRYLRHRADRQKAEADRIAEEERARAAKLAALAQQVTPGATKDALVEKAQAALTASQEAAALASGPISKLSQERSFSGFVSGLTRRWFWRERPEGKLALIKAIADGKESMDLVILNDKLLATMARAKKDKREPVGIEFYYEDRGR